MQESAISKGTRQASQQQINGLVLIVFGCQEHSSQALQEKQNQTKQAGPELSGGADTGNASDEKCSPQIFYLLLVSWSYPHQRPAVTQSHCFHLCWCLYHKQLQI